MNEIYFRYYAVWNYPYVVAIVEYVKGVVEIYPMYNMSKIK